MVNPKQALTTTIVDELDDAAELAERKRIVHREKMLKKLKGKKGKLFSGITYTLDQISPDKEKIFRYVELFLQLRPETRENADLAMMLFYYQGLSDHQKSLVTYEEMMQKFNVDPTYFIASISGGVAMINLELSKVVASQGMPDVVKEMLERAKSKGGAPEAKMLLQLTGLLDSDGIKIQNIVNGSTNNVNVSTIPDFQGQMLASDSSIRSSYKQALDDNTTAIEGEIVEDS